jgi:hypothetical protein
MGDTEMAVAYTCSTPVARKEHTCCECRQPIQKGEKYHRFSGIWDGIGCATYKTCLRCQRLAAWYVKKAQLLHDEMPAFGHLFADIRADDMRVEDAIAEMEKEGNP